MQTSPDAALVLRARQELEQELAQIRSSLLEVQSVRDEVLDVAKQIDEAVSPIASIRPPSLSELIKEPTDKPLPHSNNGQAGEASVTPADEAQPVALENGESGVVADEMPAPEETQPLAPANGEPEAAADDTLALDASQPGLSADGGPQAAEDQLSPAAQAGETQSVATTNGEVLPERARDELIEASSQSAAADAAIVNGAQPELASPPLSSVERDELSLRIQALMADLHALQEQLRRRGLLDPDWQPPSWAMQLPDVSHEAPIEEADR
jgi:hypothetical protein